MWTLIRVHIVSLSNAHITFRAPISYDLCGHRERLSHALSSSSHIKLERTHKTLEKNIQYGFRRIIFYTREEEGAHAHSRERVRGKTTRN